MNREQMEKKFQNRVVSRTFEAHDLTFSIRPLSASERAQSIDRQRVVARESKESTEAFDTQIERTLKNVACFVICRGLVDDEGKRLYSDDEADKIIEIYPGDLLEFISSEILTISGVEMSREDAVKNSDPAPKDSFSSDSPVLSDGGM